LETCNELRRSEKGLVGNESNDEEEEEEEEEDDEKFSFKFNHTHLVLLLLVMFWCQTSDYIGWTKI
jgi:hypothetical protein